MGRRASGEGSIFQLKSGRWRAQIDLGLHQGKRRFKVFEGPTQRVVQDKLLKAKVTVQSGFNIAPQKQTVREFLHLWLDEVVKTKVRAKTEETFRQLTETHLIPGLGSIALAKLKPQHIQRFMNEKAEAGLSATSVRHLRDTLRNALNTAVKWDMLQSNPASKVDPPRIERRDPTIFNIAQARAFLDAARGHRWEALFSVVLALGLRRGEALGLGWSDVDLTNGLLRIRYGLQRVSGKLIRDEVKTKSSNRVITLPMFAADTLREHQKRQALERAFAGDQWTEAGLVFTTSKGTAIDPRNLLANFYRLITKAGVPKIRFHDLRHSAASLLLARGVHPKAVQELLGHSDVSMTLNTYSHLCAELRLETARTMQDLFRPTPVTTCVTTLGDSAEKASEVNN